MTLYYDDNRGTDQFSLQDFEPSSRLKMNAAVREAWLESPGVVFRDWATPRLAKALDHDASRKLSAQEFSDRVKASGLKLDLSSKDNEYTEGQLDFLLERQRELTMIRDVRERTPWSIGTPVRGLAMFGAALIDPINLATAFVPWTRAISAAQGLRAAALSSSFATRTAGRAGLGAIDAGISTAVLEPFYFGMRQSLGDDYDGYDAMANIAFGTLFGGSVIAGGGAVLDAFRRVTGRALPSDAYRGLTVDEIQMVQNLRAEVASGMDARDVQRVLQTYTPKMRRAAGFPDADDALDVVVPPPGMATGGPARVKIGDDYEPAEWAVVEASQLTATVDKADNQFRDRNRAAYQAEIQARANALDPAQVLSADNPLMDVGPPTVSVEGQIIGGNGRTLFIQRAYEIGKGNDYREALIARLEALGLDPAEVANMKQPVLVRRLTRKVDVKRAAMLSNEGGSSVMSPLEQAKVDAERLQGLRLESDQDGNLDTAANRAAIRKWVEQQPEGQRNALMTEDGMLSASGLSRLRNAVLFQAYGDSPTLARLIEATDVGSRNVAAALARTAGRVAESEAAIGRGELHPLSLADDIRAAVEQFDNLRRQGTKVADYLAQMDAFGDPLTSEARLLLDAIGRNISSSRRLGDVIAGYYDRVQDAGNPAQGDMFGAVAPDRLSLLNAAIRDVDASVDNAAEITAAVDPETREAALRTAVAQSAEGRVIDVEAIVNTDEAAGGSAGTREINDAAARNRRPESIRSADFDASAAVDERLAAAPKWDGLSDAEAAEAEAAALLRDTVQAGDQAFKYSRGEASGQKKATLWQGTTARFSPEDGKPLGGFRWDFIGSDFGEQAQAVGYGHYLAQQAWISQTRYRERLIKQSAGKRDTYTIPDGVGGVLELSARNNDASWQLPDGTILHESQKNPAMAAKAGAIAQVDAYGYSSAKQTFKALLSSVKSDIGNSQRALDAELRKPEEDRVSSFVKFHEEQVKKLSETIAESEAYLRAVDEVTVPDAAAAPLTSVFEQVLDGLRAQGDTSSQAYKDALNGYENSKTARVLAPGIKKYEPPLPENMRERVVAGGEEITSDLKDFIAIGNKSARDLSQTLGRNLAEVPAKIEGANTEVDLAGLLSEVEALQAANPTPKKAEVIRELEALRSRGITTATIERPGSLYRAEMDAADFQNLMLWNAPLSDQPVKVREAFERWGIGQHALDWQENGSGGFFVEIDGVNVLIKQKTRGGGVFIYKDGFEQHLVDNYEQAKDYVDKNFGFSANATGAALYKRLNEKIDSGDTTEALDDAIMDAHYEIARRRFGRQETDEVSAMEVMQDSGYRPRSDEVASVILHNAGIPGHAFLDGASRNDTDLPAYNIVIYSDDVAKIVDRYARQTGEIGRATDTPEGLTEALRLSFGRDTDALIKAGRVQVVATTKDLPPRGDGFDHPRDVKGWAHPDGTAYIVAENVSEMEARGMLLHEVGVHIGMENMLGPKLFNEVLTELDDAIVRGESWAQAARAAVPNNTAPSLVREEQLAYLVQNAPDLPIVKKIIAAVRAWVYRTFAAARERMTLTEADFRAMAVSALHHAAREGRAGQGGMVPSFSRDVQQTETKAFGDWFGESKVVDEQGRPVVVYHATNADFSTFRSGRSYFADLPDYAAQFAGVLGTPSIMPVFLKIEKPLDLTLLGPGARTQSEIADALEAAGASGAASSWRSGTKRPRQVWELWHNDQMMREIRAAGFDGVIQMESVSDGDKLSSKTYMVWGPEQIKSATGNRGSFDPNNPDIRYSGRGFDAQSSFEKYGGVGDIDESTNIEAKSNAFADMAEANGYTVIGRGDKYLTINKSFGKDADGYDKTAVINVRVSDHSRVNRGYHFGSVDINIAPDDGYARDTFDVALMKIRSAYVNDDLGTVIPINEGFKYSRGEIPESKTEADAEIKRYDEAVKRAKGYAKVLRSAADKLDNDAQATAAMREAMPDITAQEIDDLLAGLRSQVKGLRGMARTARSMLGAEDQAATLQSEAMKAADMLANNLEEAAVIEKRNASLNMAARLKASTFVNQFREKGLDFEGFAALLVGSERVRTGSRVSIDAEYKGFRGEWVGGMIADVERLGLMRAFISGAFDRDIYDALYRMGAKEKVDLSGLPKEAVQLAEVVNKYQSDARNTRNRFGAWIRDLQGYITRQSHDMYKIREVNDADWIAFVKDKIDLPKMIRLGLISERDPIASLRGMYDDFAAGVHMKPVAAEEDGVAFGNGSNLARRESVSRTIYFKDGIAAYEYNERFGQGRLAESVLFGLDHAARSTALMKTLGTNPEATLTRLMDEYEDSLAGEPERRQKFRRQRGALLDMLAHVDGSTLIPGSVTGAKIGAFTRAWTTMAKLGGALISSFSDLAGYGAELRYAQGRGLLSGVADGMGAIVSGRAKDERLAITSSLGVFHESMMGAVTARFDSPDLVGGKMAAAMQMFFRLNGLNWWTETLRDGAAITHAHYMATQAGKPLDAIDPEFRRMLQLYNIDAGKWDLLRMGQMQQADGRMYLTPEGLRTVPRSAYEAYITSVGRTANDASVANLQADLAQALRVMAIDRAHHAVLEPGARTRAWMQRGTRPGTVPGELLRFIGQFKSFGVAMVQSVLGREVYGRGYDTLGEYLRKGHGDMLGLAYMVGLYGVLGYGAMAAKDLLKGREPRDPLDPRTVGAALVQGGGLGLYGDFLFGEYNRMGRTFTASLAGPVLGNADTLLDLWTRMRNGDDIAAASFKALIDNTPFLNLFWARPVLDYLVLYHIQEALNPGFLRRMEKRIERENGQSFLLPPSQVVR